VTLSRGSTSAGPVQQRDSEGKRERRFRENVTKTKHASKQKQKNRLNAQAVGGSQHQAPMRVGMDTSSMSNDTKRDLRCAFVSLSAETCPPEDARSGESSDAPEEKELA
jgi:hypothetical protein